MKVKRQALRRKDTPKGIICFSRESRENKAWASHRRVVIHCLTVIHRDRFGDSPVIIQRVALRFLPSLVLIW